jgi:hypothetical protein
MRQSVVLARHPDGDGTAVEKIEATVSWNDGGSIALAYTITGELSRLRFPPHLPPRQSDRLWEHTCFEAFVAIKDQSSYYEFNFAPSGEWAVYAFRAYREPSPLPIEPTAPKIAARSAGDRFELAATIVIDRLLPLRPGARLCVALSAVIEDNRGMLSYWALNHPPGKPDFHHPDSFVLEVEPPAVVT